MLKITFLNMCEREIFILKIRYFFEQKKTNIFKGFCWKIP